MTILRLTKWVEQKEIWKYKQKTFRKVMSKCNSLEHIFSQIGKIRLIYLLLKDNIRVLCWEYCCVLNKALSLRNSFREEKFPTSDNISGWLLFSFRRRIGTLLKVETFLNISNKKILWKDLWNFVPGTGKNFRPTEIFSWKIIAIRFDDGIKSCTQGFHFRWFKR